MSDVKASIDVVVTGAEDLNAVVRKLREAEGLVDSIKDPRSKADIAADERERRWEETKARKREMQEISATDRERKRNEARAFAAERRREREKQEAYRRERARQRQLAREQTAYIESFAKAERLRSTGVTYNQALRGVTTADIQRGQLRNLFDDSQLSIGTGQVGYRNQQLARNALASQRLRVVYSAAEQLAKQRSSEVFKNLQNFPELGGMAMLPNAAGQFTFENEWATKAPRTRPPAPPRPPRPPSKAPRTPAEMLAAQRSRETFKNLQRFPELGGMAMLPNAAGQFTFENEWAVPGRATSGRPPAWRGNRLQRLLIGSDSNPWQKFLRGRAGSALSGGLQGGAFPLMFGQGVGGVSGGTLGGVLGGALLGPGGSFAGAGLGTAVGTSFDAVSSKIKALSKDLDKPASALEAVAAAGAKVTDSDREIVAYLESIGRTGDAYEMVRRKMDDAFGPGAFEGLRVLKTSQDAFQEALTNISGKLGQAILPQIIALTDYFTELAEGAEGLTGVLGGLTDVFGYATVYIGNNIKFVADILAAVGKGDIGGLGTAFKDRWNAKNLGQYKKAAEERLSAARSGAGTPQQRTPWEKLADEEKAYNEMARKRDAALSMERESLDIARQREDLERSIAELQQKWARTLKEQELGRKRTSSDLLRQSDELGIEQTTTRLMQQRRALVRDDAKALLDGLSAYIKQRASGEADLRQKEREFELLKQELSLKQSQLEEDTVKEVYSITKQAQDYTRAVEDYKIKVADYQFQRAMDASKFVTAMGGVGGSGAASTGAGMMVGGSRVGTNGFVITSLPGPRWGRHHAGTDFYAPVGTPLGYSVGGKVLSADTLSGYGHTIEVMLDNGIVGFTAHLEKALLKAGDRFLAGQAIALTGSTGTSTGPHGHQEDSRGSGTGGAQSLPFVRLGRGMKPMAAPAGATPTAPVLPPPGSPVGEYPVAGGAPMPPTMSAPAVPKFVAPGAAPSTPAAGGFLAASRAGMQQDISQAKEALGIFQKISDEKAKQALINAVTIFDGDAQTLANLNGQLDVIQKINAIDATLPQLEQERLATQIQYNSKLDEARKSEQETYKVVQDLVDTKQLDKETAEQINAELAAGFKIRQQVLLTEQQITDELAKQQQRAEDISAANKIVNFRKGFDAGFGKEAGVYNDAYERRGAEGALAEANAARVARLQQEAVSDAEAIAGALTGGIVEALQSGNFQDAASRALASISQRLIERAFRPLEDYLINMLTKLLMPKDSLVNSAAGGLLGLGGNLFGGGGGEAASGFLTGGLFDTPFTFAGGGYTGDGPRYGGIDGEGGFPAILHPQETVVDHTDLGSAMGRYSIAASRRTSSRAGGESTMANGAYGSGGESVIRFESTVINGVEYVTRAEAEAIGQRAARKGAEGGYGKVHQAMVNRRSTRSRWGLSNR